MEWFLLVYYIDIITSGHFASSKVKQIVNRRFGEARWSPEKTDAISNYCYHISALPASGEYCLRSILIPLTRRKPSSTTASGDTPNSRTTEETKEGAGGVAAREGRGAAAAAPPETVVRVFARVSLSPELLSTGALSPPHPANTPESNANLKKKADGAVSVPVLVLYGDSDWIKFNEVNQYVEELRQLGVRAGLQIISNAGHHLYMDNPEDVHDRISRWWGRTENPSKKDAKK